MNKIKHKKAIISTFEDASILRKFTILFFLMSIIPMSVLSYFYLQIIEHGNIQISANDYNITLIFIVLGVGVGYFAMRKIIKRLIDLSMANRKALEDVLSPGKIEELSKEENEIAVLAQSFTAITRQLEENVKSLELTKRTLHSVMSKVGEGISNMEDIDTFLYLILETVTAALSANVGVLILYDDKKKECWIKAVHGLDYSTGPQAKIHLEEGTAIFDVIRAKKPIAVPRIIDANDLQHKSLFEPPLICAPLVVKDKVRGVITVSGRKVKGNFEEDEIGLLFNLACQTAVALENHNLNINIEKTYFETISALALAVDAKDKYSRGHLDRVAHYCTLIANRLGLDEDEKNTLREAARLHDLGKIGIPDEILKKKGPLTHQEMAIMRSHTGIGESIVKPIRSLNHLCDIIRHHHEKLDGTGYPDGLKGDQITPLVRITTIADIFDALTTDRPYRKKYNSQKAFEQLRRMKDQIDQDIVEVFIETLEENQ